MQIPTLQFKTTLDPFLENTPLTKTALNHYHTIRSGGKKIRPLIAFIGMDLPETPTEEQLELLHIIEDFHNFCLLQDDVMDNAKLRHGIPTLHSKLSTSEGYSDSTAKWQSILTSDLIFAKLVSQFFSLKLGQTPLGKDIFLEMINQVVTGQMLDLDLQHKIEAPLSQIQHKNLLKTARYSIYHPFLLGSLSHTNTIDTNFAEFADCLGLAYQIQDDLLDVTSTDPQNKTPFTDFATGIPSVFTYFLYTESNQKEKDELKSVFGKCNPNEAKEILTNCEKFNLSVHKTESLLNDYYESGLDKLKKCNLTIRQAEALENLIQTLITRTK